MDHPVHRSSDFPSGKPLFSNPDLDLLLQKETNEQSSFRTGIPQPAPASFVDRLFLAHRNEKRAGRRQCARGKADLYKSIAPRFAGRMFRVAPLCNISQVYLSCITPLLPLGMKGHSGARLEKCTLSTPSQTNVAQSSSVCISFFAALKWSRMPAAERET